jgi:hypothetical protein
MVVAPFRQRRIITARTFELQNRPAKPGGFCFVEIKN